MKGYRGFLLFSIILTFNSCFNNKYEDVSIGSQTWTSKNLSVTTFSNGDPIVEAQTKEEWTAANTSKTPAWCYYDGDPVNGEKYGKLYNWYAITDLRGVAPEGWRMPSKGDWQELYGYLKGADVAGEKMKTTEGWINEGNGTNESGFSSLPGGYRGPLANFATFGTAAGYWSSDEESSTNAWLHAVSGKEVWSTLISVDKGNGNGVRLIHKTKR